MIRSLSQRSLLLGGLLLAATYAFAQQHQWAGRTLDPFEWAVHERLAALPFHGVFETLNFEVQGKTVILSGKVVRENVKERAERAVRRMDGVENVVNLIEILPSSRRDDALRMNLYRAIYPGVEPAEYDGGSPPFVHIVVKDGSVTLEGLVPTDADRSAVYSRALTVTSHVSDQLRVMAQQ